ncbi:MAG: hypothetical protein ACEQSB_05445 [Undibacterium sp.]
MRTPSRLKPKRSAVKPEPLRSINFLTCLRCMGHSYFQTDPPERMTTVSFSQVGALTHLVRLSESGRISANQYALVERQILTSSLPEDVPNEVKALVSKGLSWEEKVIELASTEGGSPAPVGFFATDLAEAVHEFLLTSPKHSHLKTQ